MKISNTTLEILKNFSQINNSITFAAGSKQATISTSKTIIAVANLPESFEKSFSIYDLNNMLAVMSLLNDPVITLENDHLNIKGDNNSIRYRYCQPTVVISHDPNKEIKYGDSMIHLDVTKEILSSLNKAAALLNSEMICVEAKDGEAYVKTHNPQDENSSSAKFKLCQTDKVFSIYFRLENLKFISDDYLLEISDKRLSRWKNKNKDITYYLAPEKISTF